MYTMDEKINSYMYVILNENDADSLCKRNIKIFAQFAFTK